MEGKAGRIGQSKRDEKEDAKRHQSRAGRIDYSHERRTQNNTKGLGGLGSRKGRIGQSERDEKEDERNNIKGGPEGLIPGRAKRKTTPKEG